MRCDLLIQQFFSASHAYLTASQQQWVTTDIVDVFQISISCIGWMYPSFVLTILIISDHYEMCKSFLPLKRFFETVLSRKYSLEF